MISILPPVGLTEELCFSGHVLLDLSPVDVKTKQGADVRRAEQIKDQQLFEDSLKAYVYFLHCLTFDFSPAFGGCPVSGKT